MQGGINEAEDAIRGCAALRRQHLPAQQGGAGMPTGSQAQRSTQANPSPAILQPGRPAGTLLQPLQPANSSSSGHAQAPRGLHKAQPSPGAPADDPAHRQQEPAGPACCKAQLPALGRSQLPGGSQLMKLPAQPAETALPAAQAVPDALPQSSACRQVLEPHAAAAAGPHLPAAQAHAGRMSRLPQQQLQQQWRQDKRPRLSTRPAGRAAKPAKVLPECTCVSRSWLQELAEQPWGPVCSTLPSRSSWPSAQLWRLACWPQSSLFSQP